MFESRRSLNFHTEKKIFFFCFFKFPKARIPFHFIGSKQIVLAMTKMNWFGLNNFKPKMTLHQNFAF